MNLNVGQGFYTSIDGDVTQDRDGNLIEYTAQLLHNKAESYILQSDPSLLTHVSVSPDEYIPYAGLLNGRPQWDDGTSSLLWSGSAWTQSDGTETWTHPDDTVFPSPDGWNVGSLGSDPITVLYNFFWADKDGFKRVADFDLEHHFTYCNGTYNVWLKKVGDLYECADSLNLDSQYSPLQVDAFATEYGNASGASKDEFGAYEFTPAGFVKFACQEPFIIEIDVTAGDTFRFPSVDGFEYSGFIEWGDGHREEFIYKDDASLGHEYAVTGAYTCKVYGRFEALSFNNQGTSKDAVKKIVQFGEVGWKSLTGGFQGCSNIEEVLLGNSDLSELTSLINTFRDTFSLVLVDLSGANTKLLESMFGTFIGSNASTIKLNNFATDALTSLVSTFLNTLNLSTLEMNGFEAKLVTNYTQTFAVSGVTSLDLSSLDTSQGTSFLFTFWDSSLTNLVLGWNIENATSVSGFLQGVTLDTADYSQILVDFAAQDPNDSLAFDGGASLYNAAGAVARDKLSTVDLWNITDGGPA